MKKLIFYCLSIIILALSISSCKDDNEIINSKSPFFASSGIPGDCYDLLLSFDRPNLIGLVELEVAYQNRYVFDASGSFYPYYGTKYEMDAQFANIQRTSLTSLSPACIVVNAFQMGELAPGKYYVPSKLNAESYFGGEYNKIIIDSNQYFNKVIDSVTFGPRINITNVPMGHIVDGNQDFVINYTGASNESLVEVHIIREFMFDQNQLDTVNTRTRETTFFMEPYKGQIIIPAYIMSKLKLGFYDLILHAYEPKYISTSNGLICMLGKSNHTTTVYINK